MAQEAPSNPLLGAFTIVKTGANAGGLKEISATLANAGTAHKISVCQCQYLENIVERAFEAANDVAGR